MLLIYTCSQDVTVDLMMPFLKSIDVFRFDIDKWQKYKWDFCNDGFLVESPDGKILTDKNLKTMYIRKPMFFNAIDVPKFGSFENWCRKEIENLWRDLYCKMYVENRLALVHPAKGEFQKVSQMLLAEKYFEVPEWHIVRGVFPDALKDGEWVVKTLTQEKIGENKILFVKKVDVSKLDPQYPWFLQRKIEADSDVTVLFVNGKTFAFELDRSKFEGEDYRKIQPFDKNMVWSPFALSMPEESAIANYMKDAGLDFGRFDFLRKDKKLIFLELNANGQWAWLDIDNTYGIVKYVCDEIIKKYNQYECL